MSAAQDEPTIDPRIHTRIATTRILLRATRNALDPQQDRSEWQLTDGMLRDAITLHSLLTPGTDIPDTRIDPARVTPLLAKDIGAPERYIDELAVAVSEANLQQHARGDD